MISSHHFLIKFNYKNDMKKQLSIIKSNINISECGAIKLWNKKETTSAPVKCEV